MHCTVGLAVIIALIVVPAAVQNLLSRVCHALPRAGSGPVTGSCIFISSATMPSASLA